MINILKKIVLIGLFFYLPFQSNAWGVLGHRIVGEIAESYLTPAAKKEVIKILGTESIAMATNWADFIRSDTTFNYLSRWHYINIKAGLTFREVATILKADTAVDAYTKINFLVKQLKNKLFTKEIKAFYLKLLIHIVGDIHQPLHVGRPDDQGGNKVAVLWFNTPSNLHQVWDSRLIDFQQLSYTEYTKAINHTTKAQRIMWQMQPVSEWIWESYQWAEKIYGDIKLPDEKLSYNYNFKYIQILDNQLLKGGVHLAGLLNQIFAVKGK
ncbi:MAG: S1/P1 nuclease [Chitinophagaceae bacterium]|nr:S1/P1 nuclease [Chitinophagaceae bacterium]